MKKIHRNCHLFLFLLFIFLLIIGCEAEEEEDAIIGTWEVINFELYANMDCTGSLSDTPIFDLLNYSESYTMTQNGYTWTQTSNISENAYSEQGTYTTTTTGDSTTYTLFGASSKHGIDGIRKGYIGEDENSMSIQVQWDTDNNHIVDSCFKYTFYKVN